jgi:hypothetical protein
MPNFADLFTAFGLVLIAYSLLTSRCHVSKTTQLRTCSHGAKEAAELA